ncbi:hypothetical protein CHS0354_039568 [Potamilus streckersoni]|uniref:Uncharacterized protein n=1 Tax=Potamilus streckersoni TaxID=2493646 RepID=A0AAE0SUV1_9BIVA|nr:hypothetical protein CHS0354_039568 [Potamilus streckersoni]
MVSDKHITDKMVRTKYYEEKMALDKLHVRPVPIDDDEIGCYVAPDITSRSFLIGLLNTRMISAGDKR